MRIKRTNEQGRITGTDGGVVYVVMDQTSEMRLFSALADQDAYIEIVAQAAGKPC